MQHQVRCSADLPKGQLDHFRMITNAIHSLATALALTLAKSRAAKFPRELAKRDLTLSGASLHLISLSLKWGKPSRMLSEGKAKVRGMSGVTQGQALCGTCFQSGVQGFDGRK